MSNVVNYSMLGVNTIKAFFDQYVQLFYFQQSSPHFQLSLMLRTQFRARAVINLSVILATLPRINRFLYRLQDNLPLSEITNFEEHRLQLNRFKPSHPSSG